MKVRTGRRSFNESIIRCLVQCLSETTASPNEVCKLFENVGNMVFGQCWRVTSDVEERDEDNSDDDDEDLTESENLQQHPKKKTRVDMTFVLPSRRTIMRYLEDASYLNLEYVAQQLLNKDEKVITTGLDDTTKAAGHRFFDVKTDHITITDTSGQRSFLTTGYTENLSHSGQDGAQAYNFKLNCLALLANCSVDEIKGQIDFWMSDRGSDLNVMFDYLGVDSLKRLKCCAHIILGIDNAIDKVFKNTEQKIGVHNLLQVTAGDKVFSSPGSSIHTLGLIALAKLLSPSHASHSISLYNEYKMWMTNNEISHTDFKGFVSNRFGRIAELAKVYLQYRENIRAFFEAVVDVHSNRLVLAVMTFIENEWFTRCSEIYSSLGNLIIFPLIEFLGIDDTGQSNPTDRSWSGVKLFFDHKLQVLKDLKEAKLEGEPTGMEKLEATVIDEVIETVERQLSEVSFVWTDKNVDVDALKQAPLTNLGCESEFAKFDNRIRVCGGSTSVSTLSRKNVVVTNGLLVDSRFEGKSLSEKKSSWK